MKNMKRIRECRLIRQYYMKKFAKETGNKKHTYHGIFVTWDSEENKYCLRGESLPAHPDLRETYPNGWSMLDFITEQEVSKILGEKTMKNSKRILSVKIIRQQDTDPDTSDLGEYCNRPTSPYSIDRAHSEDCASVSGAILIAQTTLGHAADYVSTIRSTECDAPNNTEWESLDEAIDMLETLEDEIIQCDCHGYAPRNELRYFNPSSNYEGDTPENIRKYTRQDYERMERLNRGDWCYLGIRAEAEIAIENARATNLGDGVPYFDSTIQTIRSGGLWGIESDSEKSYLESVEQEELSALRAQLKALGFSTRQISAAFKNITEVSE